MNTIGRGLLVPALAALSLASVACGNHFTPSPHMANAAVGPIAPTQDAATLVFVRPSAYAGVMNPSIFIDGKFVADVEAQRQVVVTVQPGDHTIVAGIHDFMTKACREMVAHVDAGKIYYIETAVASGSDLFAVRPADAGKLHQWLAQAPLSRRLDPASLSSSPIDTNEQAECTQKAAEHLAGDDNDDKAKHTLNAADGFSVAP